MGDKRHLSGKRTGENRVTNAGGFSTLQANIVFDP